MFAQVIRFNLKPNSWERLRELDERWQAEQAAQAPGFRGAYILQEQASPNGCIMVVLFESEQLARQNSDRPETQEWYGRLLNLIEGEPQFIDTRVFRSYLR